MTPSNLLYGAILRGDEPETCKQLKILSAADMSADEILTDTCIPAILEVKRNVEAGEMYIPELLIAQRAYQACITTLQPDLSLQTYQQALDHAEIDLSCFL